MTPSNIRKSMLVVSGLMLLGGLAVRRRREGKKAVFNLLPGTLPPEEAPAPPSSLPILRRPLPLTPRVLGALLRSTGTDDPHGQSRGGESTEKLAASPLARPITGYPRKGVIIHDRSIPGRDGDIQIRVYTPERAETVSRPLVVEIHGGGWSHGHLNGADWIAGTVALDLDAIVVSVDYRLSPKHPFPAGVNDCFDVVKWAAAHIAELGASAGRLGVMGESAGGNLAAVVSLLARDEGGPVVHHQALIYPAVDLTTDSRSRQSNANAPVLNTKALEAFVASYVGEIDATREWRLSPLRAPDKRHLPPALIQIAGHDPLYDDGVSYAEALEAADVPVRLTAYTAMPHGYINMPYMLRESKAAMEEIVAEQRKYLRDGSGRG